MIPVPRPLLVTHGGKFHCDEVFAYAVLRLALGLEAPGHDHTLLRTRRPELIESADIAWDVGGRFDAALGRFDHHQRGAPLRPDGTPFSSAGLVWQVHGPDAVAALLPADAAAFSAPIAAELDDALVRRIDEIDNGVAAGGSVQNGPVQNGPVQNGPLSLASLIGEFNPAWDDPAAGGDHAGDDAFVEATAFATGMLRRRVESMRARHAAEAAVLAAHRGGTDPRLLVLGRGMPWKNVVHNHALPVLLAVSPASNGNWMLDTVPPEPGSFAQKLPLPQDWAGLTEAELATASGVPDAVFVHLRRFVGAARSRDGAIAMAEKVLAAA